MGKRSKVTLLPAAVLDWLKKYLVDGNYSGYEALAAELKTLGYDISKSSLHRFGSQLERTLSAIKASTEAAKLIHESSPDDADKRSGAVFSMIQTRMFDSILSLQAVESTDDPAERAKLLSIVAKNYAQFARASVTLKKHQIDVAAKAEAAANAAAKIGKKGGLSAAGVDAIRREILGIVA